MTGVDDRCAASPRLAALSWIVQAKPLTRLHGHTGDAGLEVCLCPQNNRFIRHDQGMRKSLWDKQERFIRVDRPRYDQQEEAHRFSPGLCWSVVSE